MSPKLHLIVGRVITWSPCLLVLLWFLGISTKDVARLMLAVLLGQVVTGGRLDGDGGVGWSRKVLAVVPWVFPLTIVVGQICRVYLGDHGIDFAIFTQAIRSVRDGSVPMTTLVGASPVDFMSHHFFPFVYVLGWLSRVSLPPHLIGIVVQGASLGVAVWCFFRFAVAVGFSKRDAAWMSGVVCLNPCIRSGVSWGIHDEVFAIGLVGIGMVAWISKRWVLLALILLGVGFFKETYLLASTIAAVVLVGREIRGERKRETILIFLGTMLVTGGGAVFYFIVRPLMPEFFDSSFNPASRIASLTEWASLEMVRAKLAYVLCILGPLLFLPVLSSAGRWLLVCVIPFWGASLLSNFPEMYKGINYYSVLPAYVASFAALITLQKWGSIETVRAPIVVPLVTAFALCAGYRASPFGDVRRVFTHRTFQPDSLSMIPSNLRVVASEFDSVFVLDKKQVIRQWLAERLPLSWDVLLVRSGTRESPSSNLTRGTKVCFADETWQVYCRKGVSLKPE